MKNKVFLVQLLILSILSSCVAPKDMNLLQDIPKNYPKNDMAPVDYRIIPGDQLAITIYTIDENMKQLFSAFMVNATTQVSPTTASNSGSTGGGLASSTQGTNIPINVLSVYSDGFVNMPFVGKIYVQGMTILEAKKVIGEKLNGFSSSVSVDAVLRNRSFSVLGQAGSRIVTMNSPRMTIYQALALAGPIGTFGDRSRVRVVRQTAGGTEVKVFDIRSKDIVNSEYYYIQPNDVIYVQQMQRRFFGEVTSFSGAFALLTSMTATALLIIKLIDR